MDQFDNTGSLCPTDFAVIRASGKICTRWFDKVRSINLCHGTARISVYCYEQQKILTLPVILHILVVLIDVRKWLTVARSGRSVSS
jgi:hypothetical protein